MSATGLEVFDKTLQTTNSWLDEIMKELGPDRHVAWHALGAVLHALRDRLTVDQTAHLAAQLPLLIRGLYYDRWHPAGKPNKIRHRDEFVAHVASGLAGTRPLNPEKTARVVLKTLAGHISAGEYEKVLSEIPEDIRSLGQAQG
jgi:uncharacterized protein (DUF2267 family)